MNLNGPQQDAVNHVDGPCLVLAGPGSGKTAVLTTRIHKLIETKIPPNEILVITFTKAAAIEMKERFDKMAGSVLPVTFGTFHSLFWGILREEYKLTSENILMGVRQKQLLEEALRLSKVENTDSDYVNSVYSQISYINNTQCDLEKYDSKEHNSDEIRRVYQNYQALKNRYKLFDFDDMLLKAEEMFIQNRAILEKWQKRFSYFMVDEMQDMNFLQYKLIKMLSARTRNLFCVGDDDQSIYDFRGANPKLMLDFPKDFEDAKMILLNQNYRCPGNILNHSKYLIEHNKVRFSKEINANKEDSVITYFEAESAKDEAKKIVNEIKQLVGEKYKYDECAILYRNHCLVNFVVEELISNNIPFYLKDSMPNIFTHFAISDILTYLNISLGKVTRSAMLSILNKPNRFLYRQCLDNGYSFQAMREFYIGNSNIISNINALENDMLLISKMSAYAAVNYIRKVIGYDEYLKEISIKKGVEVSEYYDVLDFLQETIRDCRNIKKAIEKIEYLKEKIDFENKNKSECREGKVGLYTLHSSKGLEFSNVFIIGVNEGKLPTKRAQKEEEVESERRLFYVGVTRSKDRLYISYLNEKNRDRSYPSRFISEFKGD